MRQSIRLSTLKRDHGPVFYKHEADALWVECSICEGSFAGVKGGIAHIGVHADIELIWDVPLPSSIKTITHLNIDW
jgi:hypothetical protein